MFWTKVILGTDVENNLISQSGDKKIVFDDLCLGQSQFEKD